MIFQKPIQIDTAPNQLNLITDKIVHALDKALDVEAGLLNLFIQHTSASLLIQENADPTAKSDLETFIDKIAPQNQSWMQHTLEGPDDSPSHMRAAITNTSITIPITKGQLGLGTWQGIYLWEHRNRSHKRNLIVTVYS
ncbi:MAG: hypothetical protein CL677_00530 [Bdellovibrionaceae bacterium]|nr:hypothetical protein [Pseudobdellovibrionaceae bacterium]|tara:strand:+ start:729 stop:1145 length:417 start_codon:yes stop_codon:yes gene_type:complete